MQTDDMESDQIIALLNRNKGVSRVASNKVNDYRLTEAEKGLIDKYKPEKVLIVYGTLAPDKPNHHVVEHIKGKWQKAIVRGKLQKLGWGADLGYYAFRYTSPGEQDEIPAWVLHSDELIDHWERLDEFEGSEYNRMLAKYELENGDKGIGFIYAINE